MEYLLKEQLKASDEKSKMQEFTNQTQIEVNALRTQNLALVRKALAFREQDGVNPNVQVLQVQLDQLTMENKLINEQCDTLEQQLVRKQQFQQQDEIVENANSDQQPANASVIEISQKDHIALLKERQVLLRLLKPDSQEIDDI